MRMTSFVIRESTPTDNTADPYFAKGTFELLVDGATEGTSRVVTRSMTGSGGTPKDAARACLQDGFWRLAKTTLDRLDVSIGVVVRPPKPLPVE